MYGSNKQFLHRTPPPHCHSVVYGILRVFKLRQKVKEGRYFPPVLELISSNSAQLKNRDSRNTIIRQLQLSPFLCNRFTVPSQKGYLSIGAHARNALKKSFLTL